ncbi:hypothetical protein XTGART2_3440 [Xanthomonas translucens pv. graminis]|uniref:DNA topoisomerase I catalytic core eukaryotic-type domain-containing protein n=1 Tax=Xanthomonas graminis pv. graminis TaxID=134874 RepID=A0A1M4JME3_9XANT|nr:putative DNA topoisomerase [Xanthomonas translucens pv. graminis ART-Xtg29]SBV44686.1 hypothetical protein XTGART2_3440 [Xanthomonas translucens pv. graminis]SBV48793.1 hypothetical protein XTGART29_3469 [Xanthomonas translucens pv. graminis ART-Xtg29]SBV60203.1 hypothetical protein XTGICMP6431_3409 [Xanthomonas translucens pv. graminis]SBV89504.1 hypothetical protein XTGNCPPB3709_3467 [Xanthomonas translucens pv. graminis]
MPGQALFQYRDDDGQLQPVDSGEVNDYLREAMGESFTAKDFRTWGGTRAALQRLAQLPLPEPSSERALTLAQNAVIREVADALGNTPAVCRKAYIDPCVFDGWRCGDLHGLSETVRGERQWDLATLRYLARARAATRKTAKTAKATTSRQAVATVAVGKAPKSASPRRPGRRAPAARERS